METEILLLVKFFKDFCKRKAFRSFRKSCQSDSKFENKLLEWPLYKMVIGYNKMKNYTK